MLILLSYCIIVLHDRKFTPIVIMWKPLRKIFACLQNTLDVRTSVVDSFATIYLLSYVKVHRSFGSYTSLQTQLKHCNVWTIFSPKCHLFWKVSSSICYISNNSAYFFCIHTYYSSHVYPFQFFHKFLSYFSVNWHFLHVYVDSFQGCYKDGTEPGTFDCRWFSILMLLFRPHFFIIYGFTLSMMFFVYALIVLIILLTVVVNIQPFKKSAVRYPSTDSMFFVLLSLSYAAVLGMDITSSESNVYNKILILVCLLSAFIPIFYIAFFILSWLISKMRWRKVILSKNSTPA